MRAGPPVAAALAALALAAPPAAAPPAAAQTDLGAASCSSFPARPYAGKPWSLQRVLLDEVWARSTGKGVKVAVIDSGVDAGHPQLRAAVDTKNGGNYLPKKDDENRPIERGKPNGTSDAVGHGTKVAGIIAARPADGTGFVGLAPEATVIPITQNDAEGNGTAADLAQAIDHAVKKNADIINISQDTTGAVRPDATLQAAVNRALAADIVVVASAGNEGTGGNVKDTYPASYEGVLAVAASDRNNERAPFSQSGEFVGIAAPGVDIISTVPRGGHCLDNGTSFAAPYVTGVAALVRAKHQDWTRAQVVAQLQQTAERTIPGRDRLVGWGIVDPVRALTEDDHPIDEPVERDAAAGGKAPEPQPLQLGETTAERNQRLGTYSVVGGVVLVAVVAGTAIVHRDWRRRRRPSTGPDAT